MQTKENIRLWAKNERLKLDMKDISNKLIIKIRRTEEYKNAKHIMVYYPLQNEVNLLPLLNDKNKSFYLPKVHNNELLCCPYKIGDELSVSNLKIKEPKTAPINKDILDLIFVPALACDTNNYRLGYGGGFYDRFLKDIKAITISCIPKSLLIETIYPNLYDITINQVIVG